jgi:ribosomal protein S25
VSVFDELRAMEQRFAQRAAELAPLVEEYNELVRVAEKLGFELESPGAKKPAKRAARKPAKKRPQAKRAASGDSRRRPGGTRALGEQRRARVLELIGGQPGITVPDISRRLGVDAPPVYRIIRKLQAEGVVDKEGKSLRLRSP